MNNIGTKIMLLRKQNEMSQADLAKKLNVSNKLVSKWETGRSLPSTEYLPKLCQIFNIKINELMGEEDFVEVKSKYSAGKLSFITICCMIFFCLFIAFCHLILAPAVFKKPFINDVDNHIEKTFSGTHYYLTTTIEIDDVPTNIKEYGYFNNGKVEYIGYVDDELQTIIKDGVKYNAKKQTRELFDNSKISCLYDLYLYDYEEGLIGKDKAIFEDVSFVDYIYKQFNGYYFELDKGLMNRFFDEELDSNIRITSKIKGDVDFSDGKLKSMALSFKAKLNEEVMDVSVSESFDLNKGKQEVNHVDEIESVAWKNLEYIWLSDYVDDEDVRVVDFDVISPYEADSYLVDYTLVNSASSYYIYLYDYDLNYIKRITLDYYDYDLSSYFEVVGDYVYTAKYKYPKELLYVIDLKTNERITTNIAVDDIHYISNTQTIYYGKDKLYSYNLLTKETKELLGSYKLNGGGDIIFTYLTERTTDYSAGFYKTVNGVPEYLAAEMPVTGSYGLVPYGDYYIVANKLYNENFQYVKKLVFRSSDIINIDDNLIFTETSIYNFDNLFSSPIKFSYYGISKVIVLEDSYMIRVGSIWYKVTNSFINKLGNWQ